METEALKASELVQDFDLYPRSDVDGANVTRLREALRGGATLPPLVIDQDSRRIVDGVHRYRAIVAESGVDAKIECEVIAFESDADIWREATRRNAKHGRQLAPFDRTRIIVRGQDRFGLSVDQAASDLEITVAKAEHLLRTRTATYRQRVVPIKQTLRHLAGGALTKPQYEGNDGASGMRPLFYVNQVINLLEHGLVEPENRALEVGLNSLSKLLERWHRVQAA